MKYYVTPSQKKSQTADTVRLTREQAEALLRTRRERLDREYDAGLCEAFSASISLVRRPGEFRV